MGGLSLLPCIAWNVFATPGGTGGSGEEQDGRRSGSGLGGLKGSSSSSSTLFEQAGGAGLGTGPTSTPTPTNAAAMLPSQLTVVGTGPFAELGAAEQVHDCESTYPMLN